MYHRIADLGPPSLERYRLAPDRFEEHLRYLRAHGYRSVGLDEIGAALRTRRPLQGRPVLLTFDDGTSDFATEAWPRLRHYGFDCVLLIVTDHVGGRAEWDSCHGAPADLLGWDDLRRIGREGVEVGSHTASHGHLTAMPVAAVARESARSRTAITRHLGVEPNVLAYPYGESTSPIRRIVGGVGYAYGLTCSGARITPFDDPLALPRLEVRGSSTTDDLATLLAGA
jgi:peptidoglycan/xylan/chitin deacetylase (PgdA/CDA1 family)